MDSFTHRVYDSVCICSYSISGWPLTVAPVMAFQSLQLYICPSVTGSDRFSGTTALTQYWGKELSLPVPGPIFTGWSYTGQSLTLWSVEWVLPERLNCLWLFSLFRSAALKCACFEGNKIKSKGFGLKICFTSTVSKTVIPS